LNGYDVVFAQGAGPLFPGRQPRAAVASIRLFIYARDLANQGIVATLYAGAARPAERRWKLLDLFNDPTKFG
jgi:hypothetical protein